MVVEVDEYASDEVATDDDGHSGCDSVKGLRYRIQFRVMT